MHTHTCQHYLTTGMHNRLFAGRCSAEHKLNIYRQQVKMLITLEPLGIYGSNFACLYILTLSSQRHAKQ